ncbi:MAG: hypothetical protein LBC74_05700 [Planctomycetaceae bacterium]|jgi:hypothetical protein|nr:hypothetical protein [Planctomycetaceae bacterium]
MTVSVIDSVVLSDRYGDVGVGDTIRGEESMMLNSPEIEALSTDHIGKWNNLVSQTNWEKGALIISWREALITAGMPKAAYSDDAWSRRVGNVTPQHVGRLRRVSERFGNQANGYTGLYWSHFQAALDWEDAEMWLEGAVQNSWSVTQMRIQRWEAIGASEELKPRNEDVLTAELDDDVNPRNDSFGTKAEKATEARIREIGAADIVDGFNPTDSLTAENNETVKLKKKQKKSDAQKQDPDFAPVTNIMQTGEVLTNLANNTPKLPSDLAEATESFKVAILNHKLASWKDVNAETVLGCLDTLKALVTSEDT